MKNIPQHIAIIMDGNGRWAKARGLPRSAGHHQGVEACKRVVKDAADLGFGISHSSGFLPKTGAVRRMKSGS